MICDRAKKSGNSSNASASCNKFRYAAVVVFLLTTAFYTFGQDATILGTVTDPSGAKVGGATITLTDIGTGKVQRLTTNGDGDYVAPDLFIGHYTVRAEAKGFKAAERRDVVLEVDARTRVDFQMAVGGGQETVTVEGTAIAVQSDTSEISEVVNGDQLEHLGTNGRSLYTFINLTPGSSSLQADAQSPTPVGGDAERELQWQSPSA